MELLEGFWLIHLEGNPSIDPPISLESIYSIDQFFVGGSIVWSKYFKRSNKNLKQDSLPDLYH